MYTTDVEGKPHIFFRLIEAIRDCWADNSDAKPITTDIGASDQLINKKDQIQDASAASTINPNDACALSWIQARLKTLSKNGDEIKSDLMLYKYLKPLERLDIDDLEDLIKDAIDKSLLFELIFMDSKKLGSEQQADTTSPAYLAPLIQKGLPFLLNFFLNICCLIYLKYRFFLTKNTSICLNKCKKEYKDQLLRVIGLIVTKFTVTRLVFSEKFINKLAVILTQQNHPHHSSLDFFEKPLVASLFADMENRFGDGLREKWFRLPFSFKTEVILKQEFAGLFGLKETEITAEMIELIHHSRHLSWFMRPSERKSALEADYKALIKLLTTGDSIFEKTSLALLSEYEDYHLRNKWLKLPFLFKREETIIEEFAECICLEEIQLTEEMIALIHHSRHLSWFMWPSERKLQLKKDCQQFLEMIQGLKRRPPSKWDLNKSEKIADIRLLKSILIGAPQQCDGPMLEKLYYSRAELLIIKFAGIIGGILACLAVKLYTINPFYRKDFYRFLGLSFSSQVAVIMGIVSVYLVSNTIYHK